MVNQKFIDKYKNKFFKKQIKLKVKKHCGEALSNIEGRYLN